MGLCEQDSEIFQWIDLLKLQDIPKHYNHGGTGRINVKIVRPLLLETLHQLRREIKNKTLNLNLMAFYKSICRASMLEGKPSLNGL